MPHPSIIRPGRGFSPSATDSTSFAVAAFDGDVVLAGAPMLEVSGHRRRRRWVSLPFTDYCPPLRGRCDSFEFAEALERLRAQADVARLELRGPIEGPGTRAETVAYRHVLPLDPDFDRLFATFQKVARPAGHPAGRAVRGERSARSQARRPRVGPGGGLLRPPCLDAASPRRPGSTATLLPVALEADARARPRLRPARTVRGKERRGCGVPLPRQDDGLQVRRLGTRCATTAPESPLMCSAIREACERGLDIFDFGRTDLDGDSLREFKLGWGTTEEPLVYSYLGVESPRYRTRGGRTRTIDPALSAGGLPDDR